MGRVCTCSSWASGPSWCVSCYFGTKVHSHLMTYCCVLCFQGKARSERAERKVSTALILHGDLGLLGGNNEGMRSDLFFFLCSLTNNLHICPLWVCFFFVEAPAFIPLPQIHADTLKHRKTLHNDITLPNELRGEISTQFSSDKYPCCLFSWMSAEATAFHSCPRDLSSLLYLISTVLLPRR